MHLVDTHSHLFWSSFEKDLAQVIERSKNSGIGMVINVGVDVALSKTATEQAKSKTQQDFKIYSSVAIHPEEAIKYFDSQSNFPSKQLEMDIAGLEDIYLNNKETVIAIGECGLDFAYFSRAGYLPEKLPLEIAKKLQKQLFVSQIALAKKLNLPLLIHCRDDRSLNFQNTECWDEVVNLSKDWFGIYHCYSGLIETTKRIVNETNFLVSFAGNLTYPKNDYLKEAVKIIPMDRIVLETDCPFLPPQSVRGQRNEPSSILEIARKIAEIKGTVLDEVANTTTGNFKKLFKLS